MIRKICFVMSVSVGGVMLSTAILAILIYLFFNTPYLDGVADFIDTLAKEFHNG